MVCIQAMAIGIEVEDNIVVEGKVGKGCNLQVGKGCNSPISKDNNPWVSKDSNLQAGMDVEEEDSSLLS